MSTARSSPAPRKILIVEDDAGVRSFLASALAGPERSILTAADGVSGLELAQRELPHLILLDMKMPGLNGLELLQALDRSLQTTGIPVVVLTSSRFDPETRRLLESLPNVRAFLPKSANAEQIFGGIEALLRPAPRESS